MKFFQLTYGLLWWHLIIDKGNNFDRSQRFIIGSMTCVWIVKWKITNIRSAKHKYLEVITFVSLLWPVLSFQICLL